MTDHALPSTESPVTQEPRDQPVTLRDRQVQLEMEMRSIGTQRFEKMISDAKVGRRESETPYGARLLDDAVLPLAARIREFLKENEKPKGSIHSAVLFLLAIDNPELAAYQTATTILDGISTQKEPLALALRISNSLEDEVRMRLFEAENKPYFRTLMRSLNKRSSHKGYRKRVMVYSMNKAGVLTGWKGWARDDKIHLGMKLIDLFIEVTHFVSFEHPEKHSDSNPLVIVPTPEVSEWILKKTASGSVLNPELLPMIIPPRNWTNPWNGGYISKAVPQLTLVKTANRTYLEDLSAVELPTIYTAVNAIQSTAWQINAEVLMVSRELWNSKIQVGKGPSPNLEEEPPKPLNIDADDEVKKAWKRKVNEVKTRNLKATSKIIQAAKTLSIAEKFQNEEAIYFPHQLDFRGRIYAVPMFLNPQGPDFAKGLLRFSEGKPLGNQESVDWLAIHGANTFGVDKVSYEDRVAWVEENEEFIIKSAENAIDYLWWTQADKPWQFLAFCFEWYGYKLNGFDAISKIPIALDGSCNGLQHFSAMLRDEVGGSAVNLVPADKPSDIYQEVADRVNEQIADDVSPIAVGWKKLGVTRKLTKRSVMTLPYGATEFAFKAFNQEFIEESKKAALFGEDFKNFSASGFMATQIHRGIKKTVVKAMEAMAWLQEISRMASDTGMPIHWMTPSGFPVIQRYQKFKSKQIEVTLSGKRVDLRLQDEDGKIDRKKQANGVSPNFVHSLDAAALMETVTNSLSEGVSAFAMIHDSYGTHARDTSVLADALRSSFVNLYLNRDVLNDFRSSVSVNNNIPLGDLPEVPKMGTLQIERVIESKYFFA